MKATCIFSLDYSLYRKGIPQIALYEDENFAGYKKEVNLVKNIIRIISTSISKPIEKYPVKLRESNDQKYVCNNYFFT